MVLAFLVHCMRMGAGAGCWILCGKESGVHVYIPGLLVLVLQMMKVDDPFFVIISVYTQFRSTPLYRYHIQCIMRRKTWFSHAYALHCSKVVEQLTPSSTLPLSHPMHSAPEFRFLNAYALHSPKIIMQLIPSALEALPRLVRFCVSRDSNNTIAMFRQDLPVELCKLVIPGPEDFHTVVCGASALQEPHLRQHTRTIEEQHRRRFPPACQDQLSSVWRSRESIEQDGGLLTAKGSCIDDGSHGIDDDLDHGVGWQQLVVLHERGEGFVIQTAPCLWCDVCNIGS